MLLTSTANIESVDCTLWLK